MTINVNLTRKQVLQICNSLNTEANCMAEFDATEKHPGADVRADHVEKLHGWSRQFVGWLETPPNPHIPCVLE